MDLRQLRQFTVLAETLNFNRAAERLHMAQPPLSTAIRKLEGELGVTLFDRDPRGLALTVPGSILLEHARHALRVADELKRSARECATGELGRLVLGFSGTASYAVLPELIPRFQARYPKVELVLHESTTHELVTELARHTVDVALLRTPLLEACTAELLPVKSDRFVLAVPPAHALATRERARMADLAGQPFIIYSRQKVPAMHALLMLAFHQAGVAPRVVQEFVQVPTAMGLVESGLGVALVPAATARYLPTQVKLLPMDDLPDTLNIGIALAHQPASASAPTQRFVEVVRELVAGVPGAGA